METNDLKRNEVKWYNATTVKMVVVAFMVLLLMAPLTMIQSMINEREELSHMVQRDISSQWGGSQLVVGPVLNVPVTLTEMNGKEKKVLKKWLYIMPDDLNVTGTINTEERSKGIYKTVLYVSRLRMEGSFATDKLNTDSIDAINWEEAIVGLGITDMRGIRGNVKILLDGKPLTVESGLKKTDMRMSGVSAAVAGSTELSSGRHHFTVDIELAGSEQLRFVPVGRTSVVSLVSPWKTPSFSGSYLPQIRKIDEKGFKAEWNVTYLNRDIPEQWIGQLPDFATQDLGVDFFLPVNHYQKSMRSAKYGILFIVLTLLVFIYFELNGKSKVHLFQYFLVGLALVLFFSILTALSEQVGFVYAYIIASSATIMLIVSYAHSLMKSRKNTATVAVLLSALYAFLYILLQLNEYAFLAGNIGLFVILGVIMKGSLRIRASD